MTPNFFTTDVLLHASAQDAGRNEIDEYLRASGLVPGKRCFKRIIKRIRHSGLYTDGHLTVKARVTAAVLLLLLAGGFLVIGFCSARLVDDIFTVQDIGQYFSFAKDEVEKPVSPVIGEFLEPCVGSGHTKNVLVRSAQLYNVEYSGDDGCIYYTQIPNTAPKDTGDEVSDKGLYVLVDGNKALVCVTMTDEGKLFEISWSDTRHSYTIFGTKTMEDAVRLAQSVYDNTEKDAKAE